jgi:putative ATPase
VAKAIKATRALIKEQGALPVPKKLRNAVTKLMRDEGYGSDYRYPPNFDGSVVTGETYLPDEITGTRLYEPGNQGLEKAIGERLARLRGESKDDE